MSRAVNWGAMAFAAAGAAAAEADTTSTATPATAAPEHMCKNPHGHTSPAVDTKTAATPAATAAASKGSTTPPKAKAATAATSTTSAFSKQQAEYLQYLIDTAVREERERHALDACGPQLDHARPTPGLKPAVTGRDDCLVASLWNDTAAGVPHAFDDSQLLRDVQRLAQTDMAGRGPDTPGHTLAEEYLQSRLRAIGLQAFAPVLVERPVDADAATTQKTADTKSTATATASASATPAAATDAKSGTAAVAKAEVLLDYRSQWWDKQRGQRMTNFVGYVAGTDAHRSRRLLICGAHYDHLGTHHNDMYPGADDNASGVGAVLALATHFVSHPPRHTVVFVLFDGEETGFRGARHFVTNPPAELLAWGAPMRAAPEVLALDGGGYIGEGKGAGDTGGREWSNELSFTELVQLYNNTDMLAHNFNNAIRVTGTDKRHNPFLLAPLLKALRGRTTVNVMTQNIDAEGEAAALMSDHREFHFVGIPWFEWGVELHASYHDPTDTFARIHHGFYQRVVHAVLDVVLECDRQLDVLADHREQCRIQQTLDAVAYAAVGGTATTVADVTTGVKPPAPTKTG